MQYTPTYPGGGRWPATVPARGGRSPLLELRKEGGKDWFFTTVWNVQLPKEEEL